MIKDFLLKLVMIFDKIIEKVKVEMKILLIKNLRIWLFHGKDPFTFPEFFQNMLIVLIINKSTTMKIGNIQKQINMEILPKNKIKYL